MSVYFPGKVSQGDHLKNAAAGFLRAGFSGAVVKFAVE